MRVYVIQDAEGRIIGTAPAGVQEVKSSLPGVPVIKRDDEEEETLQVGVIAESAPGQTVHEVEFPRALEDLEAAELSTALLRYRLTTGEPRLVERGA